MIPQMSACAYAVILYVGRACSNRSMKKAGAAVDGGEEKEDRRLPLLLIGRSLLRGLLDKNRESKAARCVLREPRMPSRDRVMGHRRSLRVFPSPSSTNSTYPYRIDQSSSWSEVRVLSYLYCNQPRVPPSSLPTSVEIVVFLLRSSPVQSSPVQSSQIKMHPTAWLSFALVGLAVATPHGQHEHVEDSAVDKTPLPSPLNSPTPSITGTCRGHGNHWHCPDGVPEPTTPPAQKTTTQGEMTGHGHAEPTGTSCTPHHGHWDCPSGVPEPTTQPAQDTTAQGEDTDHDHAEPTGTSCTPHHGHWDCPSGVPEPTTPPAQDATAQGEKTGHGHAEPTGTSCTPHGDHWHCPSGVSRPATPPATFGSQTASRNSSSTFASPSVTASPAAAAAGGRPAAPFFAAAAFFVGAIIL
ncbi:hypothetical protein DCS_01308 [Drechmeria coniospora]|uniref:Uncharacterized protein n=1 Tax=Drechmeria coniospora TaxID=98403 RepID=A0A151GSX9_DRECN|nr:hypothetical protein DCS_01308 [Drechmeria coniospora]KYK60173.1 hypothetical protein DCS_01308 [Drechmeria coniospora]